MTETTYRKRSGSYWTYTLDGTPRIKGVTTMMKGLGGPPEKYYTETTAGFAVDNWERLAALPPSERIREIAGATRARFDEASVRGTRVHKLAEPLAHGEKVDVPEHLDGYVRGCVQFLDDYDVEVIASETAVFSRTHGYAGSADMWIWATLPSGKRIRVLGDWKTSAKGPWGSVAFQLAGYRYADFMLDGDAGLTSSEVPLPEVDECWAVWLRPRGYEVVPMHVTPDQHRELLYIDQCRMADERCREYKLDPLPPPATVRRLQLQVIEEAL